jgi:magnesium-protoporphyrin IX monomethyl ester (oxidative) cyclase
MDSAMRDMDKAKRKGGLSGWVAHKTATVRAMAAFAGLYLIPVKKLTPPAQVRMEPIY